MNLKTTDIRLDSLYGHLHKLLWRVEPEDAEPVQHLDEALCRLFEIVLADAHRLRVSLATLERLHNDLEREHNALKHSHELLISKLSSFIGSE